MDDLKVSAAQLSLVTDISVRTIGNALKDHQRVAPATLLKIYNGLINLAGTQFLPPMDKIFPSRKGPLALPVLPRHPLDQIRNALGLTKAALSRMADVSERQIRNIETWRSKPRESTCYRILNALNGATNPPGTYTMQDAFP